MAIADSSEVKWLQQRLFELFKKENKIQFPKVEVNCYPIFEMCFLSHFYLRRHMYEERC